MSAKSEKIGAEELECKAMAENAQKDLNEALPALEEAMKVGLCPVCIPSIPSEIVFTPFAVFDSGQHKLSVFPLFAQRLWSL